MFGTIPGGRLVRGAPSSRRGPIRLASSMLAVAALGSCVASSAITGVNGAVDHLTISVDPPLTTGSGVTILVGESVTLSATAVNALGLPVGAVTVTWSSEDDAIVTVTADGVVEGVSAGSTKVFASAQGVTGSVTITVEEPPSPASPRGD